MPFTVCYEDHVPGASAVYLQCLRCPWTAALMYDQHTGDHAGTLESHRQLLIFAAGHYADAHNQEDT